jgi:hypothetical protein
MNVSQLFLFFGVQFEMKRVITILILLLFLASGLPVTMARHYCCGMLADVTISLNGEKASCGMEQNNYHFRNQLTLSSKCCEDQLSSFTVNNNYFPEYFHINKPLPEKHIIYLYTNLLICSQLINSKLSINVFPPGENLISGLKQPDICVFRI